MSARLGDWIATFSGGRFWPLDPMPGEVKILDVAHALAMKCRYNGQCRFFYSVAEHSVLLSRHVAPEHALWALLHDAAEAYLADIPRPVKGSLPGWREVEARVESAVAEAFHLSWPGPPEAVKQADTRILRDEATQLFLNWQEWRLPTEGLGVRVDGWTPSIAKQRFVDRFVELLEAERNKPQRAEG